MKITRIYTIDNVGAYISKYFGKEIDDRSFGKKKFFCSQDLLRPVELIGWLATKFFEKFLAIIEPVFELIFSSEWMGEVSYRAYSLDRIPFINGTAPPLRF